VKDRGGSSLELLLVTVKNEPFPNLGRVAGRSIALRGQVISRGDLWLFRADPGTLRALP
jgi:hypothetical protein